MSYDVAEQSVHDANPIEVFKFIGTFKTYRYTSWHEQVTVNGETYIPIPMRRNAVKVGTENDSSIVLKVKVPFDTDIVYDYVYAQSPPSLSVEVRRVHANTNLATDWKMLWTGDVQTFSVEGRWAEISVPSIFDNVLRGEIPTVYYQSPCNHTLYDSLCQVNRAANTTATTVVTVDEVNLEVADDGVADGELVAGEAVCTRTGERRMVMSNAANLLVVNFPFVDLVVGDDIELSKGCDLAQSTCIGRFANGDRFGGMPYMPGDNPFEGSLT